MPRVPVIPFPEIDIDEACQIAERVVREFKGTISTSGLARSLNMAERGGGFLKKVAAVRDYGLIEGRGDLRVTDLAQRIAYPSSLEEKNQLKKQAFLRVDLFAKLAERLGGAVPEEDRFSIFVEEITRAPRMEVARRAARVRRLYAEGAKYLSEEAHPRPSAMEEGSATRQTAAPAERGVIQLRVPDVHIDVTLAMTSSNVDVVKTLLDNLKKGLEAPAQGGNGDEGE